MSWLSRILCATDFSPSADRAVEYAIFLASHCRASLDLIHVVEVIPRLYPYRMMVNWSLEAIREEIDGRLESLGRHAAGHGVQATGRQVSGLASEAIVAAAKAPPADAIVVGAQGLAGLELVLLGSTAERVVRSAPCPVLTVRLLDHAGKSGVPGTDGALRIRQILVPIDFSDPSLDALEYGVQVAKSFNATVYVLHVLDWISVGLNFTVAELADRHKIREEMEARLGTMAEVLKEEGLHAEACLDGGPPAEAILKQADERRVDMVIMGTHGRRGVSRMMYGSVAEAVLRGCRCPVLTVKSPKFAPGHRRIVPTAVHSDR